MVLSNLQKNVFVAVRSLVVMVSGFRPEGPGSILDAAKDPTRRVAYVFLKSVISKVSWSVVMGVVSGDRT